MTLKVPLLILIYVFFFEASSSVAGAVGMTTSGESESDDSEMGRLQGKELELIRNRYHGLPVTAILCGN